MDNKAIDLRSDTITRPTAAMRQAMAAAEVGDDVFGEDPTVNRLQARVAELFGREAALYVPTGTMGNQIAVNVHTRPGQEVIGDAQCHIFNFERGMYAKFSGVVPRAVVTERGFLQVSDVASALAPDDQHLAPTGLVVLENTHNMKGGGVYPQESFQAVVAFAHSNNLPVHLDGARVFNAAVASQRPVDAITKNADTVSFCFSKGLGAPVGSMLVGDKEFIAEALCVRKQLGGGMRQVGILAAACQYALDHHVERLARDHDNAQRLARALSACGVEPDPVDTNIVFFTTPEDDAHAVVEQLEAQGVLSLALNERRVRFVTHLDVSAEETARACEAIKRVLG